MATTSIWKISIRLDEVIRYAQNEDKTDGAKYNDLHRAIEYAKADYKTEQQLYATGINCDIETAFQEMTETKKLFDKEDGILGYHAFQSFAEGEVTPKQAHNVGIQLAKELWGDRFQVIVTTHLNTNHIHNHFVLNSVSFKDGLKYYNNRETYAYMRQISDQICRENRLSVIEEKPCGKYNIDYTKYYKDHIKKSNYHTIAKQDIDYAITQADTYKEFEDLLRKMDYELIYRNGVLSVRKEPYKKNIRISRAFGEDYKRSRIEERIRYEKAKVKLPFPEAKSKKYYSKKNILKTKTKAKGIRALYLYYCYLLKIYPKTTTKKKVPLSIRADVQKMHRISEEAKLLSRNNIQTTTQLTLYKNSLTEEKTKLEEERDKLYYQNTKLKKEKKQDNYEKLSEIASKIQYLKGEILKCNEIMSRVPKIKENIEELEKNEKTIQRGKEKEQNEYRK